MTDREYVGALAWRLGVVALWLCLLLGALTGCAGFGGSVSPYVGETDGSEFYGGMVQLNQPIAPGLSLFGQTEILRYPDKWWTETYGGLTYSFGGK